MLCIVWGSGLSRSVWRRLFDKLCGGESKLIISTKKFLYHSHDIRIALGLSSCCGLQTLADVCGVLDDVPLGLKEGTEELRHSKAVFSEEEQLEHLLSGQICMINFSGEAKL